MHITVIVDNNEGSNLKGEWGFCAKIDYKGKQILLDTGASSLFETNAFKLDLHLENIDFSVLSHAHYDHSDGMKKFFSVNDHAKLYLQRCCSECSCYKKHTFYYEYIGIKKGLLKKYQDRLFYVDGDLNICDGVYIVSHKSPDRDQIGIRECMYIKFNHRFYPDQFNHEQSLVFEQENGLVVFNSCSHTGPVDILNDVSSYFPGKRISAYIGGFHLYNKSDDYVLTFANTVKQMGINHIYTGHCTGNHAFELLKEQLGPSVHQFSTGLSIEL